MIIGHIYFGSVFGKHLVKKKIKSILEGLKRVKEHETSDADFLPTPASVERIFPLANDYTSYHTALLSINVASTDKSTNVTSNCHNSPPKVNTDMLIW